MDWLAKMNSALDYIEENLTGEVDYAVAARKACCSSFNFQRMFSFITGTSLAEYVRRRRLTQAGIELQNSSIKVLDLAVKYGYDSGVAFSRAFQTVHGITPTQARSAGVTLKAYPRISFQVTIKGVHPMNYRIETKEAFQMFGLEGVFHPDKENESAPVPPMTCGCKARPTENTRGCFRMRAACRPMSARSCAGSMGPAATGRRRGTPFRIC
jgi:AraC family transcriptional regulator